MSGGGSRYQWGGSSKRRRSQQLGGTSVTRKVTGFEDIDIMDTSNLIGMFIFCMIMYYMKTGIDIRNTIHAYYLMSSDPWDTLKTVWNDDSLAFANFIDWFDGNASSFISLYKRSPQSINDDNWLNNVIKMMLTEMDASEWNSYEISKNHSTKWEAASQSLKSYWGNSWLYVLNTIYTKEGNRNVGAHANLDSEYQGLFIAFEGMTRKEWQDYVVSLYDDNKEVPEVSGTKKESVPSTGLLTQGKSINRVDAATYEACEAILKDTIFNAMNQLNTDGTMHFHDLVQYIVFITVNCGWNIPTEINDSNIDSLNNLFSLSNTENFNASKIEAIWSKFKISSNLDEDKLSIVQTAILSILFAINDISQIGFAMQKQANKFDKRKIAGALLYVLLVLGNDLIEAEIVSKSDVNENPKILRSFGFLSDERCYLIARDGDRLVNKLAIGVGVDRTSYTLSRTILFGSETNLDKLITVPGGAVTVQKTKIKEYLLESKDFASTEHAGVKYGLIVEETLLKGIEFLYDYWIKNIGVKSFDQWPEPCKFLATLITLCNNEVYVKVYPKNRGAGLTTDNKLVTQNKDQLVVSNVGFTSISITADDQTEAEKWSAQKATSLSALIDDETTRRNLRASLGKWEKSRQIHKFDLVELVNIKDEKTMFKNLIMAVIQLIIRWMSICGVSPTSADENMEHCILFIVNNFSCNCLGPDIDSSNNLLELIELNINSKQILISPNVLRELVYHIVQSISSFPDDEIKESNDCQQLKQWALAAKNWGNNSKIGNPNIHAFFMQNRKDLCNDIAVDESIQMRLFDFAKDVKYKAYLSQMRGILFRDKSLVAQLENGGSCNPGERLFNVSTFTEELESYSHINAYPLVSGGSVLNTRAMTVYGSTTHRVKSSDPLIINNKIIRLTDIGLLLTLWCGSNFTQLPNMEDPIDVIDLYTTIKERRMPILTVAHPMRMDGDPEHDNALIDTLDEVDAWINVQEVALPLLKQKDTNLELMPYITEENINYKLIKDIANSLAVVPNEIRRSELFSRLLFILSSGSSTEEFNFEPLANVITNGNFANFYEKIMNKKTQSYICSSTDLAIMFSSDTSPNADLLKTANKRLQCCMGCKRKTTDIGTAHVQLPIQQYNTCKVMDSWQNDSIAELIPSNYDVAKEDVNDDNGKKDKFVKAFLDGTNSSGSPVTKFGISEFMEIMLQQFSIESSKTGLIFTPPPEFAMAYIIWIREVLYPALSTDQTINCEKHMGEMPADVKVTHQFLVNHPIYKKAIKNLIYSNFYTHTGSDITTNYNKNIGAELENILDTMVMELSGVAVDSLKGLDPEEANAKIKLNRWKTWVIYFGAILSFVSLMPRIILAVQFMEHAYLMVLPTPLVKGTFGRDEADLNDASLGEDADRDLFSEESTTDLVPITHIDKPGGKKLGERFAELVKNIKISKLGQATTRNASIKFLSLPVEVNLSEFAILLDTSSEEAEIMNVTAHALKGKKMKNTDINVNSLPKYELIGHLITGAPLIGSTSGFSYSSTNWSREFRFLQCQYSHLLVYKRDVANHLAEKMLGKRLPDELSSSEPEIKDHTYLPIHKTGDVMDLFPPKDKEGLPYKGRPSQQATFNVPAKLVIVNNTQYVDAMAHFGSRTPIWSSVAPELKSGGTSAEGGYFNNLTGGSKCNICDIFDSTIENFNKCKHNLYKMIDFPDTYFIPGEQMLNLKNVRQCDKEYKSDSVTWNLFLNILPQLAKPLGINEENINNIFGTEKSSNKYFPLINDWGKEGLENIKASLPKINNEFTKIDNNTGNDYGFAYPRNNYDNDGASSITKYSLEEWISSLHANNNDYAQFTHRLPNIVPMSDDYIKAIKRYKNSNINNVFDWLATSFYANKKINLKKHIKGSVNNKGNISSWTPNNEGKEINKLTNLIIENKDFKSTPILCDGGIQNIYSQKLMPTSYLLPSERLKVFNAIITAQQSNEHLKHLKNNWITQFNNNTNDYFNINDIESNNFSKDILNHNIQSSKINKLNKVIKLVASMLYDTNNNDSKIIWAGNVLLSQLNNANIIYPENNTFFNVWINNYKNGLSKGPLRDFEQLENIANHLTVCYGPTENEKYDTFNKFATSLHKDVNKHLNDYWVWSPPRLDIMLDNIVEENQVYAGQINGQIYPIVDDFANKTDLGNQRDMDRVKSNSSGSIYLFNEQWLNQVKNNKEISSAGYGSNIDKIDDIFNGTDYPSIYGQRNYTNNISFGNDKMNQALRDDPINNIIRTSLNKKKDGINKIKIPINLQANEDADVNSRLKKRKVEPKSLPKGYKDSEISVNLPISAFVVPKYGNADKMNSYIVNYFKWSNILPNWNVIINDPFKKVETFLKYKGNWTHQLNLANIAHINDILKYNDSKKKNYDTNWINLKKHLNTINQNNLSTIDKLWIWLKSCSNKNLRKCIQNRDSMSEFIAKIILKKDLQEFPILRNLKDFNQDDMNGKLKQNIGYILGNLGGIPVYKETNDYSEDLIKYIDWRDLGWNNENGTGLPSGGVDNDFDVFKQKAIDLYKKGNAGIPIHPLGWWKTSLTFYGLSPSTLFHSISTAKDNSGFDRLKDMFDSANVIFKAGSGAVPGKDDDLVTAMLSMKRFSPIRQDNVPSSWMDFFTYGIYPQLTKLKKQTEFSNIQGLPYNWFWKNNRIISKKGSDDALVKRPNKADMEIGGDGELGLTGIYKGENMISSNLNWANLFEFTETTQALDHILNNNNLNMAYEVGDDAPEKTAPHLFFISIVSIVLWIIDKSGDDKFINKLDIDPSLFEQGPGSKEIDQQKGILKYNPYSYFTTGTGRQFDNSEPGDIESGVFKYCNDNKDCQEFIEKNATIFVYSQSMKDVRGEIPYNLLGFNHFPRMSANDKIKIEKK